MLFILSSLLCSKKSKSKYSFFKCWGSSKGKDSNIRMRSSMHWAESPISLPFLALVSEPESTHTGSNDVRNINVWPRAWFNYDITYRYCSLNQRTCFAFWGFLEGKGAVGSVTKHTTWIQYSKARTKKAKRRKQWNMESCDKNWTYLANFSRVGLLKSWTLSQHEQLRHHFGRKYVLFTLFMIG